MTDRQDTSPGTDPVAHGGATAYGAAAPQSTTPDYSPRPVAVRRADVLGGLLLLLAGATAGVSLLLPWIPGDEGTGLDLVQRGFTELRDDGIGGLVGTGFWQPLAVALGGAALFILGLLLLLPARSHRLVGLLALLVTAVVAAAVLVPLTQAGFDPGTFRLGFWFAVGVAVLGLLGALKALLTGPRKARH